MNGTILILDDSVTVRMDLAEVFEKAGFRPAPCANTAEAREVLAGGPVDVIILDVLLPDGDGIDFLQEVRSDPRHRTTPVLMLSTETEVKDRVRGLRMGADEYIGKPYDTGYVVARAQELLHRMRPPEDGGKTVLIIDDSLTFREELAEACQRLGLAVLQAGTGDDGLRQAAVQRPDAIIVDGVLPGIDGATVIRRIRLDAALRSTPCLLLTASEDRGAEPTALDAGADAFVRKGDDIGLVIAKLDALLRQTSAPSAGDGPPPSLAGPKKILAVDDSLTYLHELSELLRGEGYDVVAARSGEEALDLLAVQPVDCILLDLVMPTMSGEETCREIKATPLVRDTPLIMLTAREDQEAMIGALGAGADDYIPKSSEFEVLTARVRAQIRRKQFEDENRHIREELLRKEMEAAEVKATAELAETRAVLVAELDRKNKELEAFSYSVSHDLRAPLRSIDGFGQAMIEEYGGTLDERGRHYLERIRVSAQHMGELIDDLLELSRVSRAEIHRDRVDLATLARAIVTDLTRNDPVRRVRVEIQDTIFAEADRGLMRSVLGNLLGNAWKFTANQPEPIIEFLAERRGEDIVYRVNDNGAGFDMNYVEKLFNPFQRLHSDADFPGTGIGLATVRRIVERHGGSIWAEASPGEGASFFFTLPPVDREVAG